LYSSRYHSIATLASFTVQEISPSSNSSRSEPLKLSL